MGNFLRRTVKTLGCGPKPRPPNRTVFVGGHPTAGTAPYIPEKFNDNTIISSKYTIWNFLPLNLFQQFQRVANFYFLCVGFVELVIDSPVNPITSILPLCFVIIVTGIKQGYEDWLRHKADNEVNNRPAHVLRGGKVLEINSMDIKVGDIVRVNMNHGIPCDMVMLSSSESNGECYITTANLDGETTLKTFQCLPDSRHLQTPEVLETFRAVIECEQPIPSLYQFVGRMNVTPPGGERTMRSLGPENVLLRGSRLKNTPFVYGCAIYTGQETKMALNSKYKTHKFSRVEKSMNHFLLLFLLILLIESSILTGLKHWYINNNPHPWYISKESDLTVLKVVEEFLSYMVLMNYIIPISMYVTVELQKFFGSMFFAWDIEMYDMQANEAAKANTSDLNEELGQVEYLFTDKTGTLTENDMQFRQCSVGGTRYIEVGGMLCVAPDIPDVQPQPIHILTADIEEFLTVLALCHTIRVDRKDNTGTGAYSHTGFEYEYQATSPDEKAFIEACRRYGVVFHGTRDDHLEVTFKDAMRRYQLLHILDFDPTRKRMSVIVSDEEGDVFLLCKGAESAFQDRVISGEEEATLQHVNDYAQLGLRTLVIGHKKLTVEEFNRFDAALKNARTTLENRDQKLADAFDMIERNITLLGATAVEDRLQEGVPETIEALRDAGIKVWVLTGDKQETAVNISYSAGHFKRDMIALELTKQQTTEACLAVIQDLSNKIVEEESYGDRKHCLIVDGASLQYALVDHRTIFRKLCQKCITVLCCRMSPLQKAEVVRLMKQSKSDPTTAAIGDGANDCSMIQEAHVGLGIMGKEGRQAVRCSDYAFSRFRFLKRALLVHGYYFYTRLAFLVQYFFYKNVAFITAQFYYAFFSSFSAQSLFDSFLLMFYNIFFTSLPIFIYSLFEQPIPQENLLSNPALYKYIRRNCQLSWGQFAKWSLLGLWHSLVCFFGVYLLFGHDIAMQQDGKMYGVFPFGSLIYFICVFIVNFKLLLETRHWTFLTHIGLWVTIIGFVGALLVNDTGIFFGYVSDFYLYGIYFKLLASPSAWLSMLLLIVIALIPDIILKSMTDTISPLYQHKRKQRKVKYYEVNKLSISFTKRSGTLTISQTNIVEE